MLPFAVRMESSFGYREVFFMSEEAAYDILAASFGDILGIVMFMNTGHFGGCALCRYHLHFVGCGTGARSSGMMGSPFQEVLS